MRKAAGIMLILFGAFILTVEISALSVIGIHVFVLAPLYFILSIISAAFLVAGGILCIRKKYWVVCLASALLAVFIVVRLFVTSFSNLTWHWILSIFGTLPIIFVCLRKSEWQEISA